MPHQGIPAFNELFDKDGEGRRLFMVVPYYERALLEPVSNALKGVGMEAVSLNGGMSEGVVFGVKYMIEPHHQTIRW